MPRAQAAAPVASAFLTGFAGLAVWAANLTDITGPEWALILLTALLVGYLLVEMLRVRRLHSTRWLLNPVVMCSFVTFMLGFGLTNFVYFLPEEQLAGSGAEPIVTKSMIDLLALVLLGAIAMWLGYWSPFAGRLGDRFKRNRLLQKFLRRESAYRPEVLVILAALSLTSRLMAIRLGVFGYSSDANRLIELGGVTQYLSLAADLGKVVLVVAALQYFSSSDRPAHVSLWFWGALGFEMVFGLLSGFKSQVVMPVVIVGACLYARRADLPWRWIMVVPLALVAAYTVIEPFRILRYQDASFDETSLPGIARTMREAYIDRRDLIFESKAGSPIAVVARSNLLQIGSLGVEYADAGNVSGDAPNFLLDIILAPIYAVLPRGIFSFKPPGTLGSWYRSEVLGVEVSNTSVAMGPFTYLYFAGGFAAVAAGFVLVGVLQRLMAEVFLFSSSTGASIPLLMLLPTMVIIDSAYYAISINLIRLLPAALILQRLIYRR